MATLNHVNGELEPMPDSVLVTDIEQGMQKTQSGIFLPDDDQTERGIRPRWAKVYATGKNIDFVKPGDWVLVEHGRWTRGVETDSGNVVRMVESDACLLASDSE